MILLIPINLIPYYFKSHVIYLPAVSIIFKKKSIDTAVLEGHNIFTDKSIINVVDLTQIHVATEEDKTYGVYKWVAFLRRISERLLLC